MYLRTRALAQFQVSCDKIGVEMRKERDESPGPVPGISTLIHIAPRIDYGSCARIAIPQRYDACARIRVVLLENHGVPPVYTLCGQTWAK